MWGLILSTAEAGGRDGGMNRGEDRGKGRGEVGRAIEGEDDDDNDENENENGSSSDDNNDNFDDDDGSCKDSRIAEHGHAFQNSSSSSRVTTLKGSTVPTGSTVTVSNNRRHRHEEKKMNRKEGLMVDEEGMRGVCQTILSVMGQSHAQDLTDSIIYGLRREGGANE